MQLTVDPKFLVQNPVAIFEYWYMHFISQRQNFILGHDHEGILKNSVLFFFCFFAKDSKTAFKYQVSFSVKT